jgi:DnaK suppressor protein
MGKRVDKPKAGKTAAAAARSKTSSSAKARKPAPAARAASSKPAAAKPAGKAVAKVAAKTAPAKPASKQVPAMTAARSMTKAAQKQSDKKLVDRAKVSAIVLPADYHPSEDEPFMNEYQRLYFNWKEEIIRQTKETLEGLHEDSVQHADLADRATSETDRALELRARDRQRKLISKIDAALARIEDGTYGYCEETGEPIGLKRLDARPIATLSLEAQERHERRERVYRED